METSQVVKEKILLQLETIIPESKNTEELMLASKAVLDLDKVEIDDELPPTWDDLLRRIAALELAVTELETTIDEQGNEITEHVENDYNPHSVSANQSGAYTSNEVDDNFSNIDHNHDSQYAALNHTHYDLVPIIRTVNGRSLVTDIDLTKADIGLNNVNNWGVTSDINNPSSELYATASAVNQLYEIVKNNGGGNGGDLDELRQALDELTLELGKHKIDQDNPHRVEVSDLDVYSKGESDNRYIRVDDEAPAFDQVSIKNPGGEDAVLKVEGTSLVITMGDIKQTIIDSSGNMLISGDVSAGGPIPDKVEKVTPEVLTEIINKQNELETLLAKHILVVNELINGK